MKTVQLNNFEIGGEKLTIFAGPCAIESKEILFKTAQKLKQICEKLDIEYKSNHKIRKTYGTMLIDGGVDDSLVAEQMGHTDVATTRKYYYFSNKSEEKKRDQISKAISF